MTIRNIIRMGHPSLRQQAQPVTPQMFGAAELTQLVKDMVETLHDCGGIGLAAPQIDVSLRVAIIDIPGGPSRYGEIAPMPLTTFINPKIEILDPTTAGHFEGCLSVPGLRGFVERAQHIQVSYTTIAGTPAQITLNGFWATVFQHEFDHLDGILYVDRMNDTRQLMSEEEYSQFGSAEA